MTSFVHIEYRTTHGGVERVESAISAARQLYRGFDRTKGLVGLLLAAMVSALVVVADQLAETWTDGHMLAVWVLLWIAGFAALALLTPPTRYVSGAVMRALDAWSRRVARQRADQRLWDLACKDPRVMADLRAAQSRAEWT